MEKASLKVTCPPARFPWRDLPGIIWLFTESDFPTFVLPNSAFGIFGALAGPALSDPLSCLPTTAQVLLLRLPLVILFNWVAVLIFDVANQRTSDAVREDQINKPWRPLPMGRISEEQSRRLLMATIPLALAYTYTVDIWQEMALILVLTWLYNDLRGGDEIVRNPIIAVAYGLYNAASLRVAVGGDIVDISGRGYLWVTMISGVILTTMQIQDLKDVEGDLSRGRLTIPILIGQSPARWMLAGLILAWSPACVWFWHLPWWGYLLPTAVAIAVGLLIIQPRTFRADPVAWRLWCFWLVLLYLLPLVASW
ncbi:UbiA family prenyltransferase, partial [Aspergillus homomorphus CBS 101889]